MMVEKLQKNGNGGSYGSTDEGSRFIDESDQKAKDENGTVFDIEQNAGSVRRRSTFFPRHPGLARTMVSCSSSSLPAETEPSWWKNLLCQLPAVGLVCILNLMASVPFGSVYFPVEWGGGDDGSGGDWGEFPLPGKDVLGIRMCLFATIVGQIVYTFKSTFGCAVSFQMIENIPFFHSMASICVQHQGNGMEALSTLFFMLASSSVLVGLFFYALGHFRLGKVVHFFPRHVLLGLIGGIGVFVMEVAVEMTMNSPFSLSAEGVRALIEKWDLLSLVFYLEVALQILLASIRWCGREPSSLIFPLYFLLITPMFYLGMFLVGADRSDLVKRGYFFPALATETIAVSAVTPSSSLLDEHIFDLWKVFNFSTISWAAVWESLPTMIALVLFSLLHVPINIPALAVSTKTTTDLDKEMVSHGWSNCLSGIFGGLQNYITYSNSLAFARAGGTGRSSSIAIVFVTIGLFLVGTLFVPYIPRCMAGALLLHVGIDLFLEGVYEHHADFDGVEYCGIWIIVIVMTLSSLEAGLVTGVFWALFTYTVQTGLYTHPVRGSMTAATLRSNKRRRKEETSVLNDPDAGMSKILVISFNGQLFFGNITQFNGAISDRLASSDAWVVILDFTHVTSIDCSAAENISKMRDALHKDFDVQLVVFVSGSRDGFPCECNLTSKLAKRESTVGVSFDAYTRKYSEEESEREPLSPNAHPMSLLRSQSVLLSQRKVSGDHVTQDLNSALMFCEDALIAWEKPGSHSSMHDIILENNHALDLGRPHDSEAEIALRQIGLLCPEVDRAVLQRFLGYFEREVWGVGETLWRHGDESTSAKLVLAGRLVSTLEEQEEKDGEIIENGQIVGELGLVSGEPRLSTVKSSGKTVALTLSRSKWEILVNESAEMKNILYMVAVQYLSNKLKLVTDGLFETRKARMPV